MDAYGGIENMKKRPVVLCILDGYGLTDRVDGNAVKLANTPNLDDLMANNNFKCLWKCRWFT